MSLLQREVERLNQALLKSREDEALLKEKASALKKSLQEAVASHSSTQSRLAALQKTLTEAEQARMLLQVTETEVGGGRLGLQYWTVMMMSITLRP